MKENSIKVFIEGVQYSVNVTEAVRLGVLVEEIKLPMNVGDVYASVEASNLLLVRTSYHSPEYTFLGNNGLGNWSPVHFGGMTMEAAENHLRKYKYRFSRNINNSIAGLVNNS
jgi:hypothetical protein